MTHEAGEIRETREPQTLKIGDFRVQRVLELEMQALEQRVLSDLSKKTCDCFM